MKRIKWIMLPAVLAIGCIAILYYAGTTADEKSKTEFREELQTNRKERNFNRTLVEKEQFTYPGASVSEWAWYENDLYLLDGHTQKIRVFSSEGTMKDELGKSGDAPWENRQTQHLWVDHEGFATIDNAHMVVKKYSAEDELIYYGKLKKAIWDGVYMGDQQFFLLDDKATDPSFFSMNAVTGTTGEPIRLVSMLSEVPENDYLNVVYEGQVLRGGEQIVYVCARTGKFFVFDQTGAYRYTGTTIDDTPPPSVTARKSGNVTYFVREPDLNINYSSTMDGTYLYILSLIAWNETTTLSIDAYDLESGQYAYSVSVPNAGDDLPVEILSGGPDMFVLYEGNQIIRYALEQT